MDIRAGLDGCGKSRPHQDSIPGPSSRYTDWTVRAHLCNGDMCFCAGRTGTLNGILLNANF
jgi:hypothetical protein